VLLAVADIFLSAKRLRSSQLYLVILFSVLAGTGAVLNSVFTGANLMWAFLTAALLAAYFQIIHSDTTMDSITGIGNRSSFTEFMNLISRMSGKQTYAMALFDINGLKKINDEHGTKTGDQALSDLAMILQQCSRQSDFIARVGDDEFLVAIRAKYDIKRMLSRILQALDAHNRRQERLYVLSISYGYSTYTSQTEQSVEELLQVLNGYVFRHKKEQRSEEAALRRDAGT
jgi:diguanylate cyclase (GGDEF)-like protein